MIRDKVGKIYKTQIPEGGWDIIMQRLQVKGKVDMKTLSLVVTELCKAIEELESER